MTTRVVHCKREPFDVLVDRTTEWGNPFKIGEDGTRAEVILKYEEWLRSQPELIARVRTELKGKTLGCHCMPYQLCHARVLAAVADEPNPNVILGRSSDP